MKIIARSSESFLRAAPWRGGSRYVRREGGRRELYAVPGSLGYSSLLIE
jgi:hypothetical protein